jgi:hypothetical protein
MRTDAATNNAGYGGVMWYGDKVFRTQGYLTKQEQASMFINEFEFMGFTNCLWALLPQAVPDRSLWFQVHVAVELDNTTAIKCGTCAVSRSIKMSEKGAEHFETIASFSHLFERPRVFPGVRTQGGEPIDKKRERDRGREGGREGEGAGRDTSRRA